MRVLGAIIVPPHLSVSGGARAGEELSAALAAHCDMTVASMLPGAARVAPAGARTVRRRQVRVRLPGPLPWALLPERHRTPFYRSDIPELVRQGRWDLVHIHNPMPALEMERVARACRASGIPYVVSTHGFNELANGLSVYRFGPVRRALWKRLVLAPVGRAVRNAAAVFALSPADFDAVRGFGYAGPELTVVGNGTAVPRPVHPDADAAVYRRLGLPPAKSPDRITCMFLANHTPNKGLGILLEAFGRLRRPYLLIVGGDKRGHVDYEAHLGACGPDQRIVLTGRLSDQEVAALYRRADLFVFPTLADTFPLVVLEAMAHGLPVLATRVGGIPHQIDAGSGVLVEPGDAAALAAAVERLAGLPRERLEAMGRHARARAAAEFTWERAAERALDGYERVLRRGRTMPAALSPALSLNS